MQLLNTQALIQRPLLMVGGKGGVGKTTVSAALALLAARNGRRTLLVSTDPAHNLSDIFRRPIGDRVTPLTDCLSALEVDPECELDQYLESVRQQMLSFAPLNQRPALERQLKLVRHSPGAEEAALLERITKIIVNEQAYDLVVFDTAPTGHTLRLLHLPQTMAAWSRGLLARREKGGRLRSLFAHLGKNSGSNPIKSEDPGVTTGGGSEREQQLLAPLKEREQRYRKAAELLLDKTHSGFLFVMTAESLPLLETARAVKQLQSERVPVSGLVVNRLMPPEAADITFLRGIYRQQKQCMEKIADLFSGLPQRHLPLLGEGMEGLEGLERIADRLAAAPPAAELPVGH
ncbi:ArsA family ATPase [Microbulbifer sp. SA54]|uniref:ArsA family ATPase n=1 Tax=Microbulbifer sp. SA54 TaxID=3401577 RepID=UPI003AAFF477